MNISKLCNVKNTDHKLWFLFAWYADNFWFGFWLIYAIYFHQLNLSYVQDIVYGVSIDLWIDWTFTKKVLPD